MLAAIISPQCTEDLWGDCWKQRELLHQLPSDLILCTVVVCPLSLSHLGGPLALSVKPDNLTLHRGVVEKVKGLGQSANLTELLLGVAPVWSAQLLHRLALADFHRTYRQRFNLQRTKEEKIIKSCLDLLNSTTNQRCTLRASGFVVTVQACEA